VWWVLCWASATLIPALTEYTFAQDIKILDGDGFLLASDTLQARFVRYFGLAAWGFNGLADLLWRPDSEELTGKSMVRSFTRDYYGHLSQLAFHARMRSMVLHDFDERPAPPKPSAPATPAPAPFVPVAPSAWPAAPAAPAGAPPQPQPQPQPAPQPAPAGWLGAPPPGVAPQPGPPGQTAPPAARHPVEPGGAKP